MHMRKREIDRRYRKSFGYIAGYLPKDRDGVDEFHHDLTKKVRKLGPVAPEKPSVTALRRLIEVNGIIRMYVELMIEEALILFPGHNKTIKSIDDLLAAINLILQTPPLFTPIKSKQNFFPFSSLFAYMMMTPAGEAIFRNVEFNAALQAVLNEWCRYLDSPESRYVLNESPTGWLSPKAAEMYKLWEFVIPDRGAPYWGFASFNAYFHREIKPECRPIDKPNDPKVIVSANDGTVYKIARKVKRTDNFWLKGQPYSLVNMLDNSKYVERFVGGDVFQSFLSGADYHRWHAPVAGTVVDAWIANGLMFSDAESAGYDPSAGVLSLGYEASVNVRGLVFIEADDPVIGTVCVIPIGITEISSVTITVTKGQHVTKGAELGYFSYGGSTLAIVFQPGAIKRFTKKWNPKKPDNGPPIDVNAQIAVANER
jgi:phosphatidylserine decarboxylase